MRHEPRLDGLRGLAILLVVIYHGGDRLGLEGTARQVYLTLVGMGWSGVDLFFVLSGFLITRILLETADHPRHFRNFYARRTLRIFPVYYLWLFFLLVLVPQLGLFERFAAWRLPDGVSSLWYWLYASNIAMALQGAWLHPVLSITWSLAIEEQFYLVWPWAVRMLGRIGLPWACAAGCLLALALRTALVLGDASPLLVFVLTPCRFDALLVGAFIAAVSRDGGAEGLLRSSRVVLPASAAALTALIVGIHATTALTGARSELAMHPLMQTAGYSLTALLYGALLVQVTFGTGRWTQLFATRLLRTFGKYSYALYLMHTFVGGLFVVYVLIPWNGGWLAGLASYPLEWALQLAIAMLAWLLVESHFLRLKSRFAM